MVDHVIGIELQIGAVRGGDQALQLFARAEPGRDRTFLVELAEVEKIIRVVAHRGIAGGLVRGRQPQRGEPGGGQPRHLGLDVLPPLERLALDRRAVPVKRLHHDAHGRLLRERTPTDPAADTPPRLRAAALSPDRASSRRS